jgi:tripartite ATP-independent transporter DctM subunit
MFAAVLGSSSGNSAVVGSVAIPELRRRKYDEKLLLGSVATAGTLGMLIPPSGAFIVYGALTNVSIASLFAAGTIPGILMAIGFFGYIVIHGMINPNIAPAEEKPLPLKETLVKLVHVWPLFLLMLLCTGPIYVGWCTAPEGAGIGALGALIIGKIFGDLNWQKLKNAMNNTLEVTAMIYFLVIGAMIMSASVTTIGAPRVVVQMVGNLPWSPMVIMICIFIFYVIMGCILDGISMMLVTMPFMAPVVSSLGFDLLWFGVLFIMVSEIGMVTPPVGLNLFVVQGIAGPKTSLLDVFMGSFPFVVIAAITMVIATIFPQIVTLLPRLIGL